MINMILTWRKFLFHRLGGNESSANAVNDRGQVAGEALNTIPDPYVGLFNVPGATQVHAFLWTKPRGMQDLGRAHIARFVFGSVSSLEPRATDGHRHTSTLASDPATTTLA
jgi:hypothetical protein